MVGSSLVKMLPLNAELPGSWNRLPELAFTPVLTRLPIVVNAVDSDPGDFLAVVAGPITGKAILPNASVSIDWETVTVSLNPKTGIEPVLASQAQRLFNPS